MPTSRSGTGRSLQDARGSEASGGEITRRNGDPYRQLWLVAAVQVLAMSVWFATAAVVPSLISEWRISRGDASWLTTAVQLGFVTGAVSSAAANLADRMRISALIATASALAGATTLLVPLLAHGLAWALLLRFLTGFALAGVYPPGVKLTASWFQSGRGLAMGVLIGAMTLGSAAPQFVNGVGTLPWRGVLIVTAALAFVAALIALRLREGPHLRRGARLRPAYVLEMFADRRQRLVNLGYFGHMWELYAFWTWLPAYLSASLTAWRAGAGGRVTVGLAAFAVIGVAGAAGSLIGGAVARRLGSERVALWAMVVSGGCSALSGVIFGAPPWLLGPLLGVWGFAVIADSAQFSAALSKAADARYVGTALTAQYAIGFLITVATIRLLPTVAGGIGWRWALTVLTLGPISGVLAMRGLVRRRPGRAEPPVRRLGVEFSE
jgi:predicted MFS family arabinose efflux permease